MTDNVLINITDAMQQVRQLVEQYGPATVELAAQVVRVNAIQDFIGMIAITLLNFAVLGFVGWVAHCLERDRKRISKAWYEYEYAYREWERTHAGTIPKRPKERDENPWSESITSEARRRSLVVIPGIIGGLMLIPTGLAWCNVWMWIALFGDPRLALAHQVLRSITG